MSRPNNPPRSSLDLPVTRLWGVGSGSAKLLARLEIRTVGDLLWHLPRRYKDYRNALPLGAVRPGGEQTVEAVLGRISERRTARGLLLPEAKLIEADGTPSPLKDSWLEKQFIKERFREGARVRLAGKVTCLGRGLVFQQPAMEPAEARPVTPAGSRLPAHRGSGGQVRRFLHTAR